MPQRPESRGLVIGLRKNIPSRHQNSFGRKRAKQCGAVRLQGIGSFCGRGNVGEGKIIPAQVLPVLQGKGPERKEAFLLTAFLVAFVATKVTAIPRRMSGPML